MMPSRPKTVLNQGTPRIGIISFGVASAIIICKSETERAIQSLKREFELRDLPWKD